jgi:hypothetical protein
METMTIAVNIKRAHEIAAAYGYKNVSNAELTAILSVCVNELLKEHTSWFLSELRELRSNPSTYEVEK